MKRSLKFAFALVFCIWFVNSDVKAQPISNYSICIEYFGEQASALVPAVISDSENADKVGREETFKDTKLFHPNAYIIDHELLTQIKSVLEKIHTHEIELRKPYVVFHVVLLEADHREVKILDGDQTFDFLEHVKNICGKGSLFDQLVYVQKVIEINEGKSHNM